ALVDHDRLREPSQDVVADSLKDVAGDGSHHQDRELIAAKAIGACIAAAHFNQKLGAFLDQPVADEMAVLVVDRLEAVEIEQGQSAFSAGIGTRVVKVESTAVGDRGQAVGETEVFKLRDIGQAEPHQQNHSNRVGGPSGEQDGADRLGVRTRTIKKHRHDGRRD